MTLADVAARAGVSPALVSIVMRDRPGASATNRERVRRAAADLGYLPDRQARLLRSGRTRLLGVVFNVRHAFHADLLTELYTAAENAGYELTLSAVTAQRKESRAITGALSERCEALILLSPQAGTAQLAALTEQTPVIVLSRPVRDRSVDVVRNDEKLGMRQAVEHLIGLGHRRIAHLDGGRSVGAAERRQGYREAMARHGLSAHTRVLTGGTTEADGQAAAPALIADPPTAVTVFNDRSATGLLVAVRGSHLRVPDDLSVVGFDDDRLAQLGYTDLTTVGQDATTMARFTIRRVIDRLEEHPIEHREIITAPRLIVRGSTGPASA